MYRDDDATLHARIAQLEEEVDAARRQLDGLRSDPEYQAIRRRREAFVRLREDFEGMRRRVTRLLKAALLVNAVGFGLLGCVVVYLVARSWLA